MRCLLWDYDLILAYRQATFWLTFFPFDCSKYCFKNCFWTVETEGEVALFLFRRVVTKNRLLMSFPRKRFSWPRGNEIEGCCNGFMTDRLGRTVVACEERFRLASSREIRTWRKDVSSEMMVI